jgi:hypothetical protein
MASVALSDFTVTGRSLRLIGARVLPESGDSLSLDLSDFHIGSGAPTERSTASVLREEKKL